MLKPRVAGWSCTSLRTSWRSGTEMTSPSMLTRCALRKGRLQSSTTHIQRFCFLVWYPISMQPDGHEWCVWWKPDPRECCAKLIVQCVSHVLDVHVGAVLGNHPGEDLVGEQQGHINRHDIVRLGVPQRELCVIEVGYVFVLQYLSHQVPGNIARGLSRRARCCKIFASSCSSSGCLFH